METKLEFVRHDKFGYLTFCPTNIGTGLRASVHVKVPKIADSGKLKEICDSKDLQPRGEIIIFKKTYIILKIYIIIIKLNSYLGVHGEHTESVGGVYDISNKIRIGRTEWDLINTMWYVFILFYFLIKVVWLN